MEQDELYEAHLRDVSEKKLDSLGEDELMFMLRRVISSLPNGGKLYKYRSMDGSSFDYAFDSLQKGYIWLSSASEFNDDEDTVLYYDPVAETEQLRQYIYEHPDTIMQSTYRNAGDFQFGGDILSHAAYGEILNCYDKDTGELDEVKANTALIQYGVRPMKRRTFIKEVKKFVKSFIEQNEGALENDVVKFLHFNENNRRNSMIFSMSETFNNTLMWSHYANSNKGFCIEYDFNKALSLRSEIRNKLINIFKVFYKDKGEDTFSFIPILDYVLNGQTDHMAYKTLSYDLIKRLITKKADWAYEREWRLFLYNTDHELYADLVSGLIIDDRVIDGENSKKLLSLCRERDWNVTVRTMNLVHTKHEYLPYDEWKTRRDK